MTDASLSAAAATDWCTSATARDVLTLVARRKQLDIIFYADGSGVTTWNRLQENFRSCLLSHKGRYCLWDLPSYLNVGIDAAERLVGDIPRDDVAAMRAICGGACADVLAAVAAVSAHNVSNADADGETMVIVNGDVITRSYVGSLLRCIRSKLELQPLLLTTSSSSASPSIPASEVCVAPPAPLSCGPAVLGGGGGFVSLIELSHAWKLPMAAMRCWVQQWRHQGALGSVFSLPEDDTKLFTSAYSAVCIEELRRQLLHDDHDPKDHASTAAASIVNNQEGVAVVGDGGGVQVPGEPIALISLSQRFSSFPLLGQSSWVMDTVRRLCAEGTLPGRVDACVTVGGGGGGKGGGGGGGGEAEIRYIPKAYEQRLAKSARDYFKSNGYLSFDLLRKEYDVSAAGGMMPFLLAVFDLTPAAPPPPCAVSPRSVNVAVNDEVIAVATAASDGAVADKRKSSATINRGKKSGGGGATRAQTATTPSETNTTTTSSVLSPVGVMLQTVFLSRHIVSRLVEVIGLVAGTSSVGVASASPSSPSNPGLPVFDLRAEADMGIQRSLSDSATTSPGGSSSGSAATNTGTSSDETWASAVSLLTDAGSALQAMTASDFTSLIDHYLCQAAPSLLPTSTTGRSLEWSGTSVSRVALIGQRYLVNIDKVWVAAAPLLHTLLTEAACHASSRQHSGTLGGLPATVSSSSAKKKTASGKANIEKPLGAVSASMPNTTNISPTDEDSSSSSRRWFQDLTVVLSPDAISRIELVVSKLLPLHRSGEDSGNGGAAAAAAAGRGEMGKLSESVTDYFCVPIRKIVNEAARSGAASASFSSSMSVAGAAGANRRVFDEKGERLRRHEGIAETVQHLRWIVSVFSWLSSQAQQLSSSGSPTTVASPVPLLEQHVKATMITPLVRALVIDALTGDVQRTIFNLSPGSFNLRDDQTTAVATAATAGDVRGSAAAAAPGSPSPSTSGASLSAAEIVESFVPKPQQVAFAALLAVAAPTRSVESSLKALEELWSENAIAVPIRTPNKKQEREALKSALSSALEEERQWWTAGVVLITAADAAAVIPRFLSAYLLSRHQTLLLLIKPLPTSSIPSLVDLVLALARTRREELLQGEDAEGGALEGTILTAIETIQSAGGTPTSLSAITEAVGQLQAYVLAALS